MSPIFRPYWIWVWDQVHCMDALNRLKFGAGSRPWISYLRTCIIESMAVYACMHVCMYIKHVRLLQWWSRLCCLPWSMTIMDIVGFEFSLWPTCVQQMGTIWLMGVIILRASKLSTPNCYIKLDVYPVWHDQMGPTVTSGSFWKFSMGEMGWDRPHRLDHYISLCVSYLKFSI